MHDVVVLADTSCLIALTKIDAIHLLQRLYGQIYITEEIAREFGESLPEWIKIQRVENLGYQQILSSFLDPGEASVLALAFELDNVLLILDDLKGRKEAERLGFRITGTLGVLYKAKETGLINKIKPYIDKLATVGFRLSPNVIDEILKISGEE